MKINKEIISYMIFGTLTTVVNIICFHFFGLILGENAYLINNVLSWIFTVVFAYITNKLWVFGSKSWSSKVIKAEFLSFLLARVFSLGLEEIGLYLLIDTLHFETFDFYILNIAMSGFLIAKIIIQVVVVISNYLFSKFLIFKNK